MNYKLWQIITTWEKHNYKVVQLRIITKGPRILKNGAVNSLQSGAINHYYTEGHVLQKSPLYYKVRQVLQIVARANSNTKWVNRNCKVGQLLQKRPVHLGDTRANGNPCLPTGSVWFENGILRTFNFRKTFNKTICLFLGG